MRDVSHPATFLAAHMLMEASCAVEAFTVAGGLDLENFTLFGKQIKIAVYRPQTDARQALTYYGVYLVRRGMGGDFSQLFKNHCTLPRHALLILHDIFSPSIVRVIDSKKKVKSPQSVFKNIVGKKVVTLQRGGMFYACCTGALYCELPAKSFEMFSRDGDMEAGNVRKCFPVNMRFIKGKSAPQFIKVFIMHRNADGGGFRMQPARQIGER